MIEAGLAEVEAENQHSKAILEMAKAVEALEGIGEHGQAADVLARVKEMQARAQVELRRARGENPKP
jgi:hypothetical protein